MNDKNKAITEMAKIIDKAQKQGYQRIFEETRKFVQENHRYSSKNDYDKAHSQTIDEIIAEALYNAGYTQKVNEDEVVIDKEEYEYLQIAKDFDYGYHEGEKNMTAYYENIKLPETAREILQKLRNKRFRTMEWDKAVLWDDIEDIIEEEYGVEVE